MDKIRIIGGNPLTGQIRISGAKNAALPLMTASLLTDEPLVLSNIPDLGDIRSLLNLLNQHGTEAELIRKSGDEILPHKERALHLQTKTIASSTAPYELVRKMRASILVLGPLLARHGHAQVSLPGGCAIGTRPVDLHIKGLTAMGADIELKDGYIHAKVPGRLKGTDITFPVISVTGTENLMMAATLAQGTTRLINAAREPEVSDLAHCLNAMGAKITGIDTDILTIEGVESLHGAYHQVLPDRIETGTYAIAAAITGGDIELLDTDIKLLPAFISTLEAIGISIQPLANGFRVIAPSGRLQPTEIQTEPYPGLPTDLQAQLMALLSFADGTSTITETIFENRFMHAPELMRMGADLTINGSTAVIKGVPSLKGAEVMATDLRASVSLILAALAAEGETLLNRVYHLDRGYERLEAKLAACNANVERLKANDNENDHPATLLEATLASH